MAGLALPGVPQTVLVSPPRGRRGARLQRSLQFPVTVSVEALEGPGVIPAPHISWKQLLCPPRTVLTCPGHFIQAQDLTELLQY